MAKTLSALFIGIIIYFINQTRNTFESAKEEVINNYIGTSRVNQGCPEQPGVYGHPTHPPYWIFPNCRAHVDVS